jgi:hypothetical protein
MVGLNWCQTYPIPNLKIKKFEKIRNKKIYKEKLKNVQKTHGKFGLVPNLT